MRLTFWHAIPTSLNILLKSCEISIYAVNSFCSCLSQTRGGASYIHKTSIHAVNSCCLRQGVEPAIFMIISIHAVNSFCSCLSQTRGGANYIHEISIHAVNSFCSCLSQTRGGIHCYIISI